MISYFCLKVIVKMSLKLPADVVIRIPAGTEVSGAFDIEVGNINVHVSTKDQKYEPEFEESEMNDETNSRPKFKYFGKHKYTNDELKLIEERVTNLGPELVKYWPKRLIQKLKQIFNDPRYVFEQRTCDLIKQQIFGNKKIVDADIVSSIVMYSMYLEFIEAS